MKKNIVLIGLGNISLYLKSGLVNSKTLNLVAVCDKNEDCTGRSEYSDYKFYTDYMDMIKNIHPDMVYLSVPANMHYKIAKDILQEDVIVISEKPACESLAEVEELYDIAEKHHVYFETLYHFEHGSEMKFLVQVLQSFGDIEFVQSSACERYAYNDGNIVPKEKYNVGDAWFDAGSNLLSNMWHMLDLSDMTKTREIIDKDINDKTRYAHKTFKNSKGKEIDLLIDWMTKNKTKYTVIQTERSRIVIDHHDQIITADGNIVYKHTLPYHRMHNQYRNAFIRYKRDVMNERKTRDIMRVLEL